MTTRVRGADRTAVFDVLLVGPYPPPFGGISVHIDRLVGILDHAGLRVGVLNHYSSTDSPFVVKALRKNPYRYAVSLRRTPARVVHYHHSRWIQFFVVALARTRQSRYIVTIHAGDIETQFPQIVSKNVLLRSLTTWALRRFDTVVVVNPTIASFLKKRALHPHIELIPAFIPSTTGGMPLPYDAEVVEFLESGNVITATAFSIQLLSDGREVYGLDTLVEAFLSVSATSPGLRLAIFVAEPPSGRDAQRHLAGLEERLAERGVRQRVRFFYGLEFAPALARSVLFVRPTRADGDAVSIREAQEAGVPVIASDVVARPTDVMTFATGDPAQLAAEISRLLASGLRTRNMESEEDNMDSEEGGSPDFSGDLLRLYQSHLGLAPLPLSA